MNAILKRLRQSLHASMPWCRMTLAALLGMTLTPGMMLALGMTLALGMMPAIGIMPAPAAHALEGVKNPLDKRYADPAFDFSIRLPADWAVDVFNEGGQRRYRFSSHSPEIFASLRIYGAMPAESPAGAADAFVANTLAGARTVSRQGTTIGNLPAVRARYQADGGRAGVWALFTRYRDRIYILWAVAPNTAPAGFSYLLEQIMSSFSIAGGGHGPGVDGGSGTGMSGGGPHGGSPGGSPVGPHGGSPGGGMGRTADGPPSGDWTPPIPILTPVDRNNSGAGGPVDIIRLQAGQRLSGPFALADPRNRFDASTDEITVVFEWSGNAGGKPFSMKWIYREKNATLHQFTIQPSSGQVGVGKGSLSRSGMRWPRGSYAVEIWHDGRKLETTFFMIE